MIEVEPIEVDGWPFPVPGLITDLVVSMDDRCLYFSNWLHGDIRQYDISDPANPKLTGQSGSAACSAGRTHGDRELAAARRCCSSAWTAGGSTSPTRSTRSWDNQFYPGLRSWMLRVDCDRDGGMELDPEFFVDLHDRSQRHGARRTRSSCRAATARRRSSSDRLAQVAGVPRGGDASARSRGRRAGPRVRAARQRAPRG